MLYLSLEEIKEIQLLQSVYIALYLFQPLCCPVFVNAIKDMHLMNNPL